MKNKIFTRIIITTLLCAFLTFNVGKVTRVSAVGTTIAASAAAALCAVGIVYCSYMALTGASVHIPDTVENIESWLTDIGTKVVQYPSGRAAYQELYSKNLSLNPATQLIHDFIDSEVWTWTAEKLRTWTNDFSSVDVIQNIASFYQETDISQQVLNGFDYSVLGSYVDWRTLSVARAYWPTETLDWYIANGLTFGDYDNIGARVFGDTVSYFPTIYTGEVRNLFTTNGTYVPQQLVNGTWQSIGNTFYFGVQIHYPSTSYTYMTTDNEYLRLENGPVPITFNGALDYPIFPQAVIHDQVTDTDLPMVVPSSLVYVENPQYPALPPEDDNKPVIPYTKLPYDPNWIDPITGNPGGGNWGINIGRILDILEELAGLMMEIGAIGELINEFKDSLTGDTYYIYYDDSDHNYYEYYTITNFTDNDYVYNINVSDVDKELPVDLNTIQTYSNNRYLEQIKQSAINGSSIVRDLAVFWYDVDPEVTYIALGICIVILIGAFTGKLGHS